jgi:hypothetical protein
VLNLSSNLNECKPLVTGGAAAAAARNPPLAAAIATLQRALLTAGYITRAAAVGIYSCYPKP